MIPWHALSKWLVAGLLLALVPAAVMLMRRNRALLHAAVALVGFLPFAGLSHFALNLISYENYRGDSRGLEITAIDFIVAALFFALPRATHPAPYRRTRWLYFAVVLFSVFLAQVPLFSIFSVWKLLRMFAVLAVMARACEDPDLSPRLLIGLGSGVCLEAVLCLWQHYVQSRYQAAGAFEHQNTLSMACNLIAPVALAVLLAGPSRMALATLVGATLCIVLALSRGSLVAFVAALGIAYAASMWSGITRRKLEAGALAGLASLLLTLKVYKTVMKRFLEASTSSLGARHLFEQAAAAMLHDHPWGIGINQFSDTLERFGYGAAAGLVVGDQSGIVHNIYWLTLAELGRVGLCAYLLMIAVPLGLALRGARRAPEGDPRKQVLLGCAAGLIVVHAQGLLEWLARQTSFSYLYWIMAALIAGLCRQLEAGEEA